MAIVRVQDAVTHTMHQVTFRGFANSASGAAELAGWSAWFAPGTSGLEHRMSREEILYVVTGSLDVQIDADVQVAAEGDCVLVPAGAALCVGNSAERPAMAWVVTTLGMTASMIADDASITPPWAQ